MLRSEIRDTKKEKPDAFTQAVKIVRFLNVVFVKPGIEIYRGIRSHSLPVTALSVTGVLISCFYGFRIDDIFMHWLFKIHSLGSGKIRALIGAMIPFTGFWVWGYIQVGVRERYKRELDRVFFNCGIETKIKELPLLVWNYPVDDVSRRLRVRSRGLPLSAFTSKRETLTSQLNANIVKIENPNGDMRLVDIIYTSERLNEVWTLESVRGFYNYSFPVGKSFRGPITASFTDCPHFLVAGASGGGKSSFIRMMLTVLLTNNQNNVEIYFIDFKGGMENQVFEGFKNVHLINDPHEAATKMVNITAEFEYRMTEMKRVGARDLESYNQSESGRNRMKRIIVVVDEISELVANRATANAAQLRAVSQILNRMSRMGRAVGINLVIGVQKPDNRNLDTTIKSNLTGIICFPVTHFSQSVVALGNARAADLSTDHPGRAIWQRGSTQFEVQTPHLTEAGVKLARESIAKVSRESEAHAEPPPAPQFQDLPAPPPTVGGAEISENALAVASVESPTCEKAVV